MAKILQPFVIQVAQSKVVYSSSSLLTSCTKRVQYKLSADGKLATIFANPGGCPDPAGEIHLDTQQISLPISNGGYFWVCCADVRLASSKWQTFIFGAIALVAIGFAIWQWLK